MEGVFGRERSALAGDRVRVDLAADQAVAVREGKSGHGLGSWSGWSWWLVDQAVVLQRSSL